MDNKTDFKFEAGFTIMTTNILLVHDTIYTFEFKQITSVWVVIQVWIYPVSKFSYFLFLQHYIIHTELQIRRGNREYLGIISHISP